MFSFFKKRKRSLIYLTRRNAMGDVLWLEPLIRQLAKDYLKVIVLTPYFKLFENYPLPNVAFKEEPGKLDTWFIQHIAPKWLKRKGLIDLDMAYEKKPKMHMLEAYFETAGYAGSPLSYPQLYLSQAEQQATYKYAYVLLHIDPGSVSLNYRNAHNINWQVVTQYITEKGFVPIFISEHNIGSNFGAKTIAPSIRGLVSWINGCSFFIGLDSGPSHIAAALRKPCIIFFGSVNPWFRHLKKQFHGIIMQHSCVYAGCYHEVHDTNGPECRIAGKEGLPPCCTFSTGETLEAIHMILQK